MPPFKEQLSPALVGSLADEFTRAWPEFDATRFQALALDGLEALELKARAALICGALCQTLPTQVPTLERVVTQALASPAFTGWMLWPATDAVAALTLEQPERGLPLMRALTPRWTAEGAIRPFIDRYPDIAFRHLTEWAADPDEHVRRLVSEGTRPRLPWSPRLPALIADPTPSIALLDRLCDDPSEYVRRSVANHLNDIAKDHPDLAVAVARRWRDAGGRHVERVVRHGLRSLVKQGHRDALTLVGADVAVPVEVVAFTVAPAKITIGEAVTLSCTLCADANATAEVDITVHYANRAGELTRRKTFKFARPQLRPGEPVTVERTHRFVPVSIRALYPGMHRIELMVNGRVAAAVEVGLAEP